MIAKFGLSVNLTGYGLAALGDPYLAISVGPILQKQKRR